ncbi:MAG TPA: chemotaxis protein CheW [Acidiferrobacteraceae bacterium]|nr:chemotaxis protein CheW [Acidiferrobacteraceae bacterium]
MDASRDLMTVDPLMLLRQMQRVARQTAPGLPEQVQPAPLWSGLGFRIGNQRLVTPLSQISEVLGYPVHTPVPGAKRWVRGIANVRGTLLTIVDLAAYFSQPPVEATDKARLLVMNVPELTCGVLVHEIFGLRHFDEDREQRDLAGVDNAVFMHVRRAFLRDDVLWGVFDMQSLAESVTFRHVAA